MILKGSKRYIAFAAALVTLISALTSCSSSSGSSSSQTNNASSSSASDTTSESNGNTEKTAVEYENKLFDTSYVHMRANYNEKASAANTALALFSQ